MFSSAIDILCLFWCVLEGVRRILHTVSIELSIHQSRLLLPRGLQNVTRVWEKVLYVNTISNMIRIYTLEMKANVGCVAD